jgi:hypothetical protein
MGIERSKVVRPTPQIADTEAAGADLEYREVPVSERHWREAKRYRIGGYVHDKCKHRKKGNDQ